MAITLSETAAKEIKSIIKDQGLADGVALRVELHHTVAFGVVDVITENRCSAAKLCERPLKAVATVKNIVAEDQRHAAVANE